MVRATAVALHVPEAHVMVSSTGVIGQYMPMEKISPAIEQLAGKLAKDGNADAAEAIMTTDTFAKEAAVKFTLGGKVVTIGGVAKGSGMIAFVMATILAFFSSFLVLVQALLTRASSMSHPPLSVTRAFLAIPLARTRTMSFVLMSPSTLIRLKTGCLLLKSFCQQRLIKGYIGRKEGQHGRHIRRDHP